jgi:hypothetical protein
MRRRRPPSPNGFFAALRTKLKAYDDALASLNRWDDGQIDAAAFVDCITGPLRPAPQLRIQAWVPEPVARYFRESYEAAIAAGSNAWLRWLRALVRVSTAPETGYEDLDIVAGLAGHGCMRAFYEELFRRKDGGDYVYPAISEGVAGRSGDADSRQVTAVIQLLDAAVQAAKVRITPPLTRAEIKQRYEIAVAMERLLTGYDVNPDFDQASVEALDSAAVVYRKRAEGYQREMEFAPVYKSSRSRDRMFVIQIGDAMQRLFGVHGMYGTVANLATAALGHEITKAAVQKWLGDAPPYKKGG